MNNKIDKPNIITLYSEEFCDQFKINEDQYNDFVEVFKESPNFDETKVADLLYFSEELFHEASFGGTKQRLRLKIADIASVISIQELFEFKHFELKQFINADRDNYQTIFANALSERSEVLKNEDNL
jgi:hypothetical protein